MKKVTSFLYTVHNYAGIKGNDKQFIIEPHHGGVYKRYVAIATMARETGKDEYLPDADVTIHAEVTS
jgi:hypothetical protein